MAWKAMAPVEVCDMMDFWIDQAWPLTRDEVHRLAIDRFGWTERTEEDRQYLVNSVSGLTDSHVSTTGPDGPLASLAFSVTHVIRERTRESTELLGDRFTLLVREGAARWGKPTLSDSSWGTSAQWEVVGGARVRFSRALMAVHVAFETPDTAERERMLGNR